MIRTTDHWFRLVWDAIDAVAGTARDRHHCYQAMRAGGETGETYCQLHVQWLDEDIDDDQAIDELKRLCSEIVNPPRNETTPGRAGG